MSEKEKTKKSPILIFRENLGDREKLKATITEGLKSSNAKVRALAAKLAFRTQEYAFVKQNVLPLLKSEKSKKVLRTLAGKIYRKDLHEKVKKLILPKKLGKKPAKAADPAAPAPAEKSA